MLQSPKALRSDHLVISQQPSRRQLPGLSRVWRSRNACWRNGKLPPAGGEKSGSLAPLGASAGVAGVAPFRPAKQLEGALQPSDNFLPWPTQLVVEMMPSPATQQSHYCQKKGSRASFEAARQVLLRTLPKVSTSCTKVSLGFSRR